MNGKIMLNGKAYSSSGRPSKEVTMAEWLALPDTKYTDGIVYYIKDVGSSSQYPPLIYSDYEREVGVWRDGKPLYQKTVYISALPSARGTGNYAHNIDNVDLIWVYDGYTSDNDANKHGNPLNFNRPDLSSAQESVNYEIGCNVNKTNIIFRVGQNRSVMHAFVTLLYTKTTDLPGSGMWNTDGGKMRHYSTNEKVVGTWIDGKPIYEKCFDGLEITLPNTGTWIETVEVPNGKDLIDIKAYADFEHQYVIADIYEANISYSSYLLEIKITGKSVGRVLKRMVLQYTKTTD